jgi:hypothetical protein
LKYLKNSTKPSKLRVKQLNKKTGDHSKRAAYLFDKNDTKLLLQNQE